MNPWHRALAIGAALSSLLLTTGFMTTADRLLSVAPASAPAGFTGALDVVASPVYWGGLVAASAADRGTAVANVCLEDGTTCADVVSDGTTGFPPNAPTISGTQCNGSTHICQIAILYDKSGNANDLQWGSAGQRPRWAISAIGSHACMSFVTGNGSTLESTSATITQAQPLTFSSVDERTGATTSYTNPIATGNAQRGYGNQANRITIYAGSEVDLDTNSADNVFHAVQGIINSASSSIYSDGTSTGTQNAGTGSPSSSKIWFGSSNGSSQFMTGYICEGGMWGIAFDATQQSNMNSNQHSRWGF